MEVVEFCCNVAYVEMPSNQASAFNSPYIYNIIRKKILHQSCATRWKQYNSFGNRAFVADIFTKAVAA